MFVPLGCLFRLSSVSASDNVLPMFKHSGPGKPLSLCIQQWKSFLYLGCASNFNNTGFHLIYAPSCFLPIRQNEYIYIYIYLYKILWAIEASVVIWWEVSVFNSGTWSGFQMYGLVSGLVILKDCNPVILQLYVTQLLWDITDDHAGGQQLDFYWYKIYPIKLTALDLSLWNLEECTTILTFLRTLSLLPIYCTAIYQCSTNGTEGWLSTKDRGLNSASGKPYYLNAGDFLFWLRTVLLNQVCSFQVMYKELVSLILKSIKFMPRSFLFFNC